MKKKDKDKIALSFFIFKAIESKRYRESLADHEPYEIEEQILAADEMLDIKTQFHMNCMDGKFKIDIYSKESRENIFLEAIEYYRTYVKYYDPDKYIELYLKIYGKFEKLSELYLKAVIKNDELLKRSLEKHIYTLQ